MLGRETDRRAGLLAVAVGLLLSPVAHAADQPVRVITAAGAKRVTAVAPSNGSRYLADPCFDTAGRLVTITEGPPSRWERRVVGRAPTVLGRLPRAYDAVLGPGCRGVVEHRGLDGGAAGVWLRTSRTATPRRILRTRALFEDRPAVAWSADGRRLALLEPDDSVLRVLSTRTGRVLRTWRFGILARATLGPQALSPDGRRVTFTQADRIGQPAVYLGEVADGAVRHLAAEHADPAFDPTGTRIASTRGTVLSIRGLDGAEQAALPLGVPHARRAVWSPDGTAVAVVLSIGNDRDGIGVLPLATGVLSRRYAAPRDVSLLFPRWSPDGARLAVNGYSIAE